MNVTVLGVPTVHVAFFGEASHPVNEAKVAAVSLRYWKSRIAVASTGVAAVFVAVVGIPQSLCLRWHEAAAVPVTGVATVSLLVVAMKKPQSLWLALEKPHCSSVSEVQQCLSQALE